MKAIAQSEFGDVDVLRLRDLPDPRINADQVLVEVRAAGVNPVDRLVRMGYAKDRLPHHFPLIPGWDVAGVVREVGPAVEGFQPGDEVFGYQRKDHVQHGTYAELIAATERGLAHKPSSLSFAEAGGLALTGLTALQALRAVRVSSGDTVLVHAAAGGVGHLAVQVARILGASRVIGTASRRNHEFLRGLGVEPVAYGDALVDNVAELVGGDGLVDVAFDCVGGAALNDSPALVRDPSRIVSIVDTNVLGLGGRYAYAKPVRADLDWLASHAGSGELKVVVQQTFPLAEAAEAHRLLEGRHVRGKIVLTV
ncbi:NADPH:quinone reductase-like Zn-dependent oxidoreductase [Saccharothrix tamanrassetensis]|uniref:NADPH:quinone reductase-like Zn-dependent oxidoreductase n=1 Tax=Saccharothrix tamanrassetensis TaxID=1051531 RepID=A0A841CJ91_9PSEU|nr:NADP-dependent oxidoreductase [Saccharothrix tamanrassetensis]MBB5957369.1 NADPH:quinone reductase-like Zn-dependent oxidoreductase [Saccharothrix tamanrassetensis]